MTPIRDYSGIDLPPVLYKYRDWEDNFHKSIITHREIYFSSPRGFTDKMDCRNPVRYDLLTYIELYQKVKSDNPDWSDFKIRKFIREWYKRRVKRILQQQRQYQESFFDKFGVFSLTADPNNMLMWLHYSNNFTGFCVGFNPEVLFNYLEGGGEVLYFDELPIIYPEPKQSYNDQFNLQIYSKLIEFQFENEYRTHIFSDNPLTESERKKILPPEAYKEIIFGKNMTDILKEDLLNSIPDELGHIELIEMNY